MRSYTNSLGDKITVDENHLETAIQIKKELQKSNPSRKVSWKIHKKCMEKEGFFDSDVNESYRCLIKDEQRKRGKLPKAPKYADMVSDGKLESIKELVGEIAYEKRENQHVLRQLNKVKREVIDFTLIAEQIKDTFKDYDWSNLKFEYKPIPKTNKSMIVCLSDLHIGAIVDTDINTYNYEVAQERMREYLNKVVQKIIDEKIENVYVMNLGDSIEHPYMHNLAYNCEFTLSEQIAKASDIIIKFIVGLSKFAKVTVAGIGGNHDRFNEDKNKNLDGDHAVKGINIAIQSFIENSEAKRIKYEQAKDYEHSVCINGLMIKFIHGDLDSINDQNLLAKHSSLDGVSYSIILMGHYHHYFIKEHGINKFVAGFGSLKGADGYSVRVRKLSSPSQGIVIIDDNKNIHIERILLK